MNLIIHPDENINNEVLYKYSDGLFYWFFLKMLSFGDSIEVEQNKKSIDLWWTRKDLSKNGCRVWFMSGGYYKLWSLCFCLEFNENEKKALAEFLNTTDLENTKILLSQIVDFYYNEHS